MTDFTYLQKIMKKDFIIFDLDRFEDKCYFAAKPNHREWDPIPLPLESKTRALPLSHFRKNELLQGD